MQIQDIVDPQVIMDMLQKRAWLPLGALAVGVATRLLRSDIKFFPNVPPLYRVWACFGLGQIAGGLEAVIAGKTYKEAILWGLIQSVIAIIGHNTIIESLRGGKEIPVPGLTRTPLDVVQVEAQKLKSQLVDIPIIADTSEPMPAEDETAKIEQKKDETKL